MTRNLGRILLLLSVTIAMGVPSCKTRSDKVTIGYVSTGLTGLAVKVMIDQRIPEKHGIEFEYQGFPNPTSLNTTFALGKSDVNIAAGANVIALYNERGKRLVYFHPSLTNSVSLLVKSSSPYQTVQDLKGKKIGWYGEASGGGTAFYLVALNESIDIKKDVQLIESSPPALWPLLDRGEVEAIIIYEPFVARMLATGNYRSVLGPFSAEWKKHTGYELEMAGLACSEDWYNKNKDTKVKQVVDVWNETANYIKSHFEEVIRRYPDLTDLRAPAEIELAKRSIPQFYVSEWGSLDTSIDLMLRRMAEHHSLIQKYPTDMVKKTE